MDHAVHLDQIGQIAITVSDLARAKDFYRNTLGMTFLFDAGPMAFFQCGGVRLLIGTAETPTATGDSTILYFQVSDIGQTYESLAGRGVPFVQPPHIVAKMPDHDLWIAFFKDPDDHTIGLMSEVPRVAT